MASLFLRPLGHSSYRGGELILSWQSWLWWCSEWCVAVLQWVLWGTQFSGEIQTPCVSVGSYQDKMREGLAAGPLRSVRRCGMRYGALRQFANEDIW